AETFLDAAFAEDGFGERGLSGHTLVAAGLNGHRGVVKLDVGLDTPLIGLGASAETYYPAVAALLKAEGIIPQHAEVANAIGAVVGHVRISGDVLISQPEAGRYRVHLHDRTETFSSLDEASGFAEENLGAAVRERADEAGAEDITLKFEREDKTVEADGQTIFVEAVLRAQATGRPRFSI
ncbi:MAG: hydantoinase/oxoprolinase family protein, partial [Hyphomicrobiaceae bacterium]